MDLIDRALIAAVAKGIPLSPKPFAAIGETLGMNEPEILGRLQKLIDSGIIRRFGAIVRHRELGYAANAMVVWQAPDDQVSEIGHRLGACQEVTLCYRRARRPGWPYNLFTMIHGRDRSFVEAQIEALAVREGISEFPRATLFSLRRFKQCGASYDPSPET